MEPSISHGAIRRSRDSDVITTSGTGKRRRFACQDEQDNVLHLQYPSERDVDVNFQKYVVSTAVSGSTSDHVNSSLLLSDGDSTSISDLKAECFSEIEIFMSVNGGFSEIESAKKKRKKTPAPAAMMPSPAEIEEFFGKAEAYEQKRFLEKYNYDIVKDVPMEGSYQWVRLKLKP